MEKNKKDQKKGKNITDSVKRFLVELCTDYIDIVLLHSPVDKLYINAYEQLIECKKHGLINELHWRDFYYNLYYFVNRF